MDADRLRELRGEIAAIDRRILELTARRMEIARAIGEYKQAASLPVRDYRTEVEVLKRTREACRELGLDVEFGETVIRQLIEGSVRAQHALTATKSAESEAPRRVLVVGGAGRMGAWLAGYFQSQGHEVTVHDV
ncbi:MAG: chorismate mutase, partial [Candidatus Xenobia bacterium]